jgi:hypothetical protein
MYAISSLIFTSLTFRAMSLSRDGAVIENPGRMLAQRAWRHGNVVGKRQISWAFVR